MPIQTTLNHGGGEDVTNKAGDEYFEYDCPSTGIDFDVHPLPVYGGEIQCSACSQTHRATELIGAAHRFDVGGALTDITDEWKSRSIDWITIDTLGSMYEEQTNRLGQWRHRMRRTDLGGFRCNGEYHWPPEHPWQDGRASR